MEATTALITETEAMPAWFETYLETWRAGAAHTFVLTGDVYGYATGGVSQKELLEEEASKKRDVVITYNRARGFSFGPLAREKAMRAFAIDIVGGGKPPAEKSAMASAIAEVIGKGNADPNDPFSADMSVPQALRLIEKLVKNGIRHTPERKIQGRVAVIIEQAELLCPQTEEKGRMNAQDKEILGLLFSWGQSKDIARCNNPIFLLCNKLDELHQDLRSSNSGMKVIEVELPDKAARLAYLTRYLAKRQDGKKPIPLIDLTVEELANTTAGLNLRHLEDILLLGYSSTPSGVTRQLVQAREAAIIAAEFSEVAEKIEPLKGGFEALGGQEHLINWMRSEIIEPLRKGSTDVPKGALLVGPPGTGKTYTIRALAAEVGFNAVMLRTENILSKYVGESEAKLKRFFSFAKALSPVLVFFDELDQSDMSRRGGEGNPVASNLFNQMLQFMSDETLRGRVICFFASNRPDKIDSALLRFGRMDAIVPVLLPNEQARQGIVLAQARGQEIAISDQAVEIAAARSDKYSAADLAAIVAKAKKLAKRVGRETIDEVDIERAMGFIKPNTPEIADEYTLLAIQACNDTELLPPEWAEKLENRKALKAEIKAVGEESGIGSGREDRNW